MPDRNSKLRNQSIGSINAEQKLQKRFDSKIIYQLLHEWQYCPNHSSLLNHEAPPCKRKECIKFFLEIDIISVTEAVV